MLATDMNDEGENNGQQTDGGRQQTMTVLDRHAPFHFRHQAPETQRPVGTRQTRSGVMNEASQEKETEGQAG